MENAPVMVEGNFLVPTAHWALFGWLLALNTANLVTDTVRNDSALGLPDAWLFSGPVVRGKKPERGTQGLAQPAVKVVA
ncbi:MAG: hypothetical protein ACK418_13390 [Pseudomonas sp.]|uniref:hypothetical protein n=1 Tax=Pseudomonas sp. TaxID=306 RepID=UPI00391C9CF3